MFPEHLVYPSGKELKIELTFAAEGFMTLPGVQITQQACLTL